MDLQHSSHLNRPACMATLGLLPPYSREDVEAAYRAQVWTAHPDRGGSVADFLKLQEAYEQAMEYVRSSCPEKRPDRRNGSAMQLQEDLLRALNRESVRARLLRRWKRAWKWARRRPALAALVAGIVVATVGLLGGRQWFRAAPAEDRNQAKQARDDAGQARNEAQQRAIKEIELRQAVEQEKGKKEKFVLILREPGVYSVRLANGSLVNLPPSTGVDGKSVTVMEIRPRGLDPSHAYEYESEWLGLGSGSSLLLGRRPPWAEGMPP